MNEENPITADDSPLSISSFETRYSIEITGDVIINCISKPPNWFHRKMMSLFFGWKFKLKPKDNE